MVSKEFVLAGRAVFTVESPGGQHYTYRVSRKEADDRWPEAYFVSLLTGPDNTRDYSYLGKLDRESGAVSLTAKSKFREDAFCVRLLRRLLLRVWLGETDAVAAAGYKVHHEGRCGRCGRALTVPASIERGIGPECWGYVQVSTLGVTRDDLKAMAEACRFASDGADTSNMTPVRNAEGEVTHWMGADGRVVFND